MTTGLPVFDTTLRETNLWLKDLEAGLGATGREACEALRATLGEVDKVPRPSAQARPRALVRVLSVTSGGTVASELP